MKTKAIVATLLIAAAASADARFAWPYPRRAVSPDEIGHWVVINGNAWPDSAESEVTTASPSGGGPDGLKSSPTKRDKAELKTSSASRRPHPAKKRAADHADLDGSDDLA
jgi:hypothetical protein